MDYGLEGVVAGPVDGLVLYVRLVVVTGVPRGGSLVVGVNSGGSRDDECESSW